MELPTYMCPNYDKYIMHSLVWLVITSKDALGQGPVTMDTILTLIASAMYLLKEERLSMARSCNLTQHFHFTII